MRTSSYLMTLSIVALVGCAGEPTTVTTTTTQEVTTTGPAREVVVTRQPPPVRVETQTVAPGPGYVWTSGYWRWTGTTYVWVPGSWIARPRPAAVWWKVIGCLVTTGGYGFRATGSERRTSNAQLSTSNSLGLRHQPRILAKMRGVTIVASDSMMNFGVSTLSFPHVIFSFGTAPEYDPKLVVESLIWQK